MTANATGWTTKLTLSAEKIARAKELVAAGFVHVTGLPTYNFGRPQYVIQATMDQLARFDYNNGKGVIVTVDGEVWLAVGSQLSTDVTNKYAGRSGAIVPCSNGEEVPMHLLLERVANPYSDCNGSHSPIPEIRKPDEPAAKPAE
jgi:hypothetical protein